MCPTKTAVSESALSLLLDALEETSPTTRKALANATKLGLTTVTRAASVCVSHGILRYEQSFDPVSGRASRALIPTEGLLIPVLTLIKGYGVARVLDTRLNPVATSVAEFALYLPPEEQGRLLSRRCLALLRGYGRARESTATAPVLLIGQGLPAAVVRDTVTDTMGAPPLASVSHGEAIARALGTKQTPAHVSSLLFVSVGEDQHACLLLRDGSGRWCPSPLGKGLTHTLATFFSVSDTSGEGFRRGTAFFLTELCRFLRPNLIYIEDHRGALPDGSVFASLLPEGVEVVVRPPAESLSVAEEGAGLIGRRILWDKILQG